MDNFDKILLSGLMVIFVVGCLPLTTTVHDILEDPPEYLEDSAQVSTGLGLALPDFDCRATDLPLGVVMGYIIAFFRRLYVNWVKNKKGGSL